METGHWGMAEGLGKLQVVGAESVRGCGRDAHKDVSKMHFGNGRHAEVRGCGRKGCLFFGKGMESKGMGREVLNVGVRFMH